MTPTSTAPPRRPWHRYAVIELSIVTGDRSIVSWHMTKSGAIMAVADLNSHYWGDDVTGRGRYVEGVFEWQQIPAGHPLVRELVAR